MILYAVILFAAAALFAVVAVQLRNGRTDLIAAHWLEHIPEEYRKAYGRACAKALFVIAGICIGSGSIALCGRTKAAVKLSAALLFAGLAAAVLIIGLARRKK